MKTRTSCFLGLKKRRAATVVIRIAGPGDPPPPPSDCVSSLPLPARRAKRREGRLKDKRRYSAAAAAAASFRLARSLSSTLLRRAPLSRRKGPRKRASLAGFVPREQWRALLGRGPMF